MPPLNAKEWVAALKKLIREEGERGIARKGKAAAATAAARGQVL